MSDLKLRAIFESLTRKFVLNLGIFSALILALLALGIPTNSPAQNFDHNYTSWSRVLQDFTVAAGPNTLVNYLRLKADSRELQKVVTSIQSVTESQFETFSRPQQIAFLINSYNALTLKLVSENYPVRSIKDIGPFFSTPWKQKFFTLFGEKQSLDFIEHTMLRARYSDPRIHFALVCASKGCPRLSVKPYLPTSLESQLNGAAKSFLTDSNKNRYENGTLYISKIFKWFHEDFEADGTSVKDFIARYMASTKEQQIAIRNLETKIEYLDYDWSLNDTYI